MVQGSQSLNPFSVDPINDDFTDAMVATPPRKYQSYFI